jgi:hypothetical protein
MVNLWEWESCSMGILSLNGKKLKRRQEGRKTTRMEICE